MRRITALIVCVVLILGISSVAISCGTTEEDPEEVTFIDGYVMDKETESPLSGVTVYLDDETFKTGNDGRYYFLKLEPGKEYSLICKVDMYQTFTKKLLAVYPSTNQNINMEMLGINNPKPSPIKACRIDHLTSFDFSVEHGVSENTITIREEGSYSAPDRFKFKLSTSYQKDIGIGGAGDGQQPQEKPSQYCIQIGDKQWIDYGDGYFENTDKKHIGFEDVFGGIEYAITRTNQALEISDYVIDLGEYEVAGRRTRRLKTLTIVPSTVMLGDEEVEQKLRIEVSASICTEEGELKDVPIDISVSVFESVRKIKTFTHFRLTNVNVDFKINPPAEGESATGKSIDM